MKIDFKVIEYGSPEWKNAVQLREDVLRKPIGSLFTSAELDEEKNHFQIAGFLEEKLVATAVLVPEDDQLKMQRVAVNNTYRNLAIGTKMLIFCEEFGQNNFFKIVYCHARDTAVNFYLKNHYAPVGEYFNEDGIPHLKMYKSLDV